MRLLIVTGMSGAGRTTALKMLEDMDYFCVDNLPIPLLTRFMELVVDPKFVKKKAAIGVDIRNGQDLPSLQEILEQLPEGMKHPEILFLDAGEACLVKRYKETRRSHPLSKEGRIEDGIREERRCLEFLRAEADYYVDTTDLLTRDLRKRLEEWFADDLKDGMMRVSVMSFGFKYGIPADCDLVFDVRFLPNPYYIDHLKHHTGLEACVQDYVMSFDVTRAFLDKLVDMIRFLIPNYISEGKTQLVIGIGCTGGHHRSVTLACALYDRLKDQTPGAKWSLSHRDCEQN